MLRTVKYLAAYLLSGINTQNPSAADVTKILSSVGAEVDAAIVKQVCDAMDGQAVSGFIEAGEAKFASVPSGGAAPAGGAVAAGSSGAADAAPAAAAADDESSSGSDMGFGLFD